MVPGISKLKSYMKARGLTQSAFAEAAGVPGPQVSLWLSEARRPSIASALKIESATGGSVVVADWVEQRKRPAKSRRSAPRRVVRSAPNLPDHS
jgi:transcriptional regulator with XRE-family HTH domain